MTHEEIVSVLKTTIGRILPHLDMESVSLTDSLHQLGANSVDRADILMDAMADLRLKVDMIQFVEAQNIGDIVSIFEKAQ